MSHVVLSRDAAGEPRIDEVDTLDGALRQVERLRNDEGVTDVRILREVPIEVKTYYKVVAVDDRDDGDGAAAPVHELATASAAPATPPASPPGPRTDPPSGSAVLSPPAAAAASTATSVSPTPGEDLGSPAADRRGSLFSRG